MRSHSAARFKRAEMNRKLCAALKPGGMLVIADHSAKPGDGTSVGKSLHRIEESALRGEVEAAGFKLVGEADFWRHAEDARDFSIQPLSNRPPRSVSGARGSMMTITNASG